MLSQRRGLPGVSQESRQTPNRRERLCDGLRANLGHGYNSFSAEKTEGRERSRKMANDLIETWAAVPEG